MNHIWCNCKCVFNIFLLMLVLLLTYSYGYSQDYSEHSIITLRQGFNHLPDSARPGVYWYFMDGWMSQSGIRKDLESIKRAGIGRVIFLEVNVGVPRGPVDFLSDQWFSLFRFAVDECQKLGIAMTLGVGPGWAGSGGPWIMPAQSMQQLVSSSIQVSGPGLKKIKLPLPKPKEPYFGEGIFTPKLKKEWEDYYKDVAVLSFPTPETENKIKDIDEKALYYRAPFSSVRGVKPFLPSSAHYARLPDREIISENNIVNLTDSLSGDGTVHWDIPRGNWTIMRFVSRNNGALTRPAPFQGLGFESNKLDTSDTNWQLNSYVGKIIAKLDNLHSKSNGGLKTLHLDSWEMGAQNWTSQFRKDFLKLRGYDPLPFYPVLAGNIVGSLEISNRFLWDLRETCNELLLSDYAGQIKKYAHHHGFNFSVEPYDMNPSADLELGSVADLPMSEFWSKGYGFNTSFSCMEATSIAHIEGQPIVQSESFTADANEAWRQYPGSMKNQGDWAFAVGINRFYFHTFAHKPLADSLRPGMTMGPYGVHWDRKQTWWPMVYAYHEYISRCQYLLQQGKPVADILYLTPEGAPQVFLPPPSAMTGDSILPDRKGYNFDGCSPKQLYQATVKNHEIIFPSGASYHVLVLPAFETMTPKLLEKICSLVKNGVTILGAPPLKSPSLSDFPACDQKVRSLALKLWGSLDSPENLRTHLYGKGKVIWGDSIGIKNGNILYPDYNLTADILKKMGVQKDFQTTAPIRYTHRTTKDWDIYFVSNRTDQKVQTNCTFRSDKGSPELWDPLTGKTSRLPGFSVKEGLTTIPLQFEAYQSFFIVFTRNDRNIPSQRKNFSAVAQIDTLKGSWNVSFDPYWGGPKKVVFDSLVDWILRPEKGIKYYSGTAVYAKSFDFPSAGNAGKNQRMYLNLGVVKDMAHVWLNGKDLGIVWTAPWHVDITGIVKQKDNHLKISVANLWPNRLIGDQQFEDDGIKNGKFPGWLLKGQKRPGKRYTFTTYNPYKKDSPLLPSGLIGPVTIQRAEPIDYK